MGAAVGLIAVDPDHRLERAVAVDVGQLELGIDRVPVQHDPVALARVEVGDVVGAERIDPVVVHVAVLTSHGSPVDVAGRRVRVLRDDRFLGADLRHEGERVRPLAAIGHVVGQEQVVEHPVVGGIAIHRLTDIRLATVGTEDQHVVAGAAVQSVLTIAAVQEVDAVAAVQHVIADAAHQVVGALATVDGIVAGSGFESFGLSVTRQSLRSSNLRRGQRRGGGRHELNAKLGRVRVGARVACQ